MLARHVRFLLLYFLFMIVEQALVFNICLCWVGAGKCWVGAGTCRVGAGTCWVGAGTCWVGAGRMRCLFTFDIHGSCFDPVREELMFEKRCCS